MNGLLFSKGNFKDNNEDGDWVSYHEYGGLRSKGNWKNNKKEGDWVGYIRNGTVYKPETGTFKDGVKISD